MEVPMITIKIKGLEAIHALGAPGSLKLKGVALLAQDAANHFGQVEAIRVGAVKAGKVVSVKAAELEGAGAFGSSSCPLAELEANKLYIVAKGGATKASGAAAAKALAPAGPAIAAKSKTVVLAGKGAAAGIGAGVSAWVPVIALGAFGLGALAYYFYRRNRELNAELEEEFGEEAASA